ncbi:hypothetical protein [Emticicia sp. SJ17W-69]|uniref:hypothetical protein n=1 Tax=Emticicia sp. SJ17W-69 TaxID=3421657 RepID=UPI003EB9D3A1
MHYKYEKGNYTSSHIFTTHYGFCYATLSDSSILIKDYSKFEDNFLETFGSSFAKAIQACIKNDNVELAKQIEKLVQHINKKSIAKHYVGCINAFKGILQKDKYLTELGIKEFSSLRVSRRHVGDGEGLCEKGD